MKQFETAEELLEEICAIFKMPKKLIVGKCRERQLVRVRHYYCYIGHSFYKKFFSLKKLAEPINRDHTSIINGRDSIRDYIDTEDAFIIENINKIKSLLEIIEDPIIDLQGLLEHNRQLLDRVKELKKENIKLNLENLNLKLDLKRFAALKKSIYG